LAEKNDDYQACVAPYQWFVNDNGGTANPAPLPACCLGQANPDHPMEACPIAEGYCTSTSYYAASGCATATANHALGCPVNSGVQQEVGPGSATSPATPNGRNAIQNTNYARQLYEMGNQAYRWQFDDAFALQSCPAAADTKYTVTLCPNGGTPYDSTQEWTYSAATGCSAVRKERGVGAERVAYSSLVACQRANLKYACAEVPDKAWVTNAIWTVVLTDGVPYSKIPKPTLMCQTIMSPSGSVPNCIYVYPGGSLTSPCGTAK
jgi:hypothetical protein